MEFRKINNTSKSPNTVGRIDQLYALTQGLATGEDSLRLLKLRVTYSSVWLKHNGIFGLFLCGKKDVILAEWAASDCEECGSTSKTSLHLQLRSFNRRRNVWKRWLYDFIIEKVGSYGFV